MKLLLDTHIFLWYFGASKKSPPEFADAIRSPENETYLSVVSLCKAIIKYNIGKLPLPQAPEVLFPAARSRHRISNLDLSERKVKSVAMQPLMHSDPFDRAIIAQAITEDMTIVTVDRAIMQYSVTVLSNGQAREKN